MTINNATINNINNVRLPRVKSKDFACNIPHSKRHGGKTECGVRSAECGVRSLSQLKCFFRFGGDLNSLRLFHFIEA